MCLPGKAVPCDRGVFWVKVMPVGLKWCLPGKGGSCDHSACWMKEIHVSMDIVILVKGCLLAGQRERSKVGGLSQLRK